MSGPWEDFQTSPAQAPGPWEDFQQAPAQSPQASPASSDAAGLAQYAPQGIDEAAAINQLSREHPALENAAQAGSEMVQGMIPRSPGQYMKQLFPPLGAYDAYQNMRQGNFRDIPFVGSVQDIQAADQTPAFSKERFSAAGHALMDLGLLGMGGEAPRAADAAVRESMAPEAPAPPKQALEAAQRVETAPPVPEAANPPSGDLWYQGVGPEGTTTWVTSNLEKAKTYASRRGEGGKINVYTPDQIGESAFADQEGNPLSPQEYAKTQSEDTTIQRLGPHEPLPEPVRVLAADGKPLQPEPAAATIPSPDELRPQDEPRPADQAVEQPAGQQQPAPERGIDVGRSGEPPTGTEGGQGAASTKNAYTDEARSRLGFPEATAEAARDFGTVWQEAEETARRDPGAGARLVEQINDGKTKSIDDHDNALLLREQISAQGEHTDAVNAVNEAATDSDRTAAKARLVVARDRLQSVYDADKKAGRSAGQGLNARKMLAAEDYSLAQMEARKRAANDGQPLNARQLQDVQVLHDRIAELSDRVDNLQRQRSSGVRAISESKKRLTDFTGEKAAKARERMAQRRAEGRLYAGVDPVAVADHVIIGADYLARGITKFSDWSAAMVKELGEKIRPFLRDLYERAKQQHSQNLKETSGKRSFKPTGQTAAAVEEFKRIDRTRAGISKQTEELQQKLAAKDFTKATTEPRVLDKTTYQMRANLQRLKNEFERGVAKDAYKHMSKADKFWQHFVGIERAGKLSSPAVFEKLGLAAAVRETMAPLESAGGYAVSKVFPKLAKGTRYGADLKTVTRAEIKAKASLFTQGMKDAWENVKGKETPLEAMSDKYGRQPDFWYNRIGKIHAAIKAPIKRAEFTRSLELRMNAAVKAGEDINHPEVMDRLATESALDANRAIFQQNTVVSKFFSMLDKASPAGGRVARFLFPVVKIPVNLFKELVTYNMGAPVAAARIGKAYWKGVETLEPAAREAIIRQLVKGSVGGAALLWGYYNSEKVHDFFKNNPPWFQHTPIAMAIHEGSIINMLGDEENNKEGRKGLQNMAKYDIPFMYTVTGAANAFDARNPHGWRDYLYSMIQSSTVPQAASWTAKEMDKPTPFSLTDKPAFRVPTNIKEAIYQGIPGLRDQVPEKEIKGE